MTGDIVKTNLINAINMIQKLSGRKIAIIDDETRPIGDLEDFDSINAAEVAAEISIALGKQIDVSVFFTSEGRSKLKSTGTTTSLKISKIVENITNS